MEYKVIDRITGEIIHTKNKIQAELIAERRQSMHATRFDMGGRCKIIHEPIKTKLIFKEEEIIIERV